tara:strand:+ start:175 stop:567 length:393 start_codon:yes stop_codon:yes gene_type:complete
MLGIFLALSPADYGHLARVIQVEAARNTLDEYCVAASVLNRVKSPLFPDTVEEVVNASGAYEGFYYSQPRPDPELVIRLQSEEGQEKLSQAFVIIKDRTDYKGQSMLKYRIPEEDPMCDRTGNFYHYHWQ